MKRAILTLTMLAVIGAAVYLAKSPVAEPTAGAVVRSDNASSCRWGADKQREARYHLQWHSEQSQGMGPTAHRDGEQAWLQSQGQLEGTLVMQAAEWPACVSWVWLEGLEIASSRVQGEELLTEPTKLEGQRALARWTPEGQLESVGFGSASDAMAQNVLTALLTELQVILPDPGLLRTNRGLAHTTTQARGAVWQRRKTTYQELAGLPSTPASQQLDARAAIVLGPAGQVRKLHEHEQLKVQGPDGKDLLVFRQTLVVEYMGARAAKPRPSEVISIYRQPAVPVVDEESRRANMEQRAAGLSATQLLAQVRSYRGRLERAGDFMWKATARLQLEPALSARLATTLSSTFATQAARELGLDLLAHTGTAEAQAAMRELLSSANLLDDPTGYVPLVQRLSFVKNPDAETVAFLRAQVEGQAAPGPSARRAATFALGSVAGHLRDRGREQEAEALVKLLTDQLSSASEPASQRASIAALGNAHDPSSQHTLLELSAGPKAEIRSAAATALRHYPAPDVTGRLLTMAGDTSSLVQRSALGSLRDRKLGLGELAVLHGHVREGRSATLNDAMLVGLLAAYRNQDIVKHTLDLVLKRSVGDAKLRARIRNLLRG